MNKCFKDEVFQELKLTLFKIEKANTQSMTKKSNSFIVEEIYKSFEEVFKKYEIEKDDN